MRVLGVSVAAFAVALLAGVAVAGETIEIAAGGAAAQAEKTATSQELSLVLPKQFFIPKGETEFSTPYIAQLLYTTDGGATWQDYQFYKDLAAPMEFTAKTEGRYGFFVVVLDREGRHYGLPDPGDKPQLTVLFDWTPPVVTLEAPRGGEVLGGARAFDIKWTASDDYLAEDPITLAYSPDGGATWQGIDGAMKNSGAYSWLPPAGMTGRVLVRASAVDEVGHVTSAVTPSPVLIDTVAPTAVLMGPSLSATDSVTLDVQSDDGDGSGVAQIMLWVSHDNGATWAPAGSTPAGKPVVFQSTSGTYGLFVSAVDRAGNEGAKPMPGQAPQARLTIESRRPLVRLKTLLSGATLAGGATLPIEWEAISPHAADRGISIYLSQDGGNTWSTVASGLANTGACIWTVPRTNSVNCLIKVVLQDDTGETGFAESLKTFSIDSTRPKSAIGIAPGAVGQPLGDLGKVMRPVAPCPPSGASEASPKPATGPKPSTGVSPESGEAPSSMPAAKPEAAAPEGARFTPQPTEPPSAAWEGTPAEGYAGLPGPEATYDDLMKAAEQAYRSNDLPIARELFGRAAVVAPEEAAPHAALGRICARQGDFNYTSRKEAFEAALYEFEKALALGGDNADVYNDMGFVLLQSGRLTDAAAAFTSATRFGERAVYWYNLGQAQYRLKVMPAARDAFEHALSIEPGMKEAAFFMGRICSDTGDWKAAREYWSAAVDGYGPDSDMGKVALSGLQQARERLGEVSPAPENKSLAQKMDRIR